MWPLWSKLSLTLVNSTSVNGTHDRIEKRGIRNLNGKVSKDMHDSRRKDKLIMCS